LPEADLGMFSMFGRTGAPQKGGPHRPEIVGHQHDIY